MDRIDKRFSGKGMPLGPLVYLSILTVTCLHFVAVGGQISSTSPLMQSVDASNYSVQKAFSIEDVLAQYSGKSTRPNEKTGRPDDVYCALTEINLDAVDETKMEFRITATLGLAWADPRIQSLLPANSDTIYSIRGADIDRIWLPDLYFPLLKDGDFHKITSTNRVVRVSKHLYPGVFYNIRLTLTQSCHMKLSNFPFDSQKCDTLISTFSYDDGELKLHWMYSQLIETGSGIQLNLPQFSQPTVKATDFTVEEIYQAQESVQFNVTYTILNFSICLHRLGGFFVLTDMLTSIILSFLSWLNYWLDPDQAPARISLGITTVLAAITQASNASKRGLPELSYITALDVWLTANVNVTIIGLAEYGLVHVLAVRARRLEERLERLTKDKYKQRMAGQPPQDEETSFVLCRRGRTAPKDTDEGQLISQAAVRYRQWAKRIDQGMRVAVPSFLVVFVAAYVSTYTIYWNGDECAQ
ncbi:glycine receptor subunit alphaZ1-like [Patiria miniata]|uniref:Uncharacterized protein n=1 Tax=Patiria miniata TaxID=46514 RepID=A0A913ZKT8_PATMI|nr:glycine receptor subunit alphaZ1-like [Patiria miniata]